LDRFDGDPYFLSRVSGFVWIDVIEAQISFVISSETKRRHQILPEGWIFSIKADRQQCNDVRRSNAMI
jgi:hypothetical protein